MNKKVAYVDSDGFRQVGELQEFEIDIFFTEEKPDRNGRYGYGFARPLGTPRGSSRGIFLPAANGHRWMRAYGIKKLEYIPQFFDEPDSLNDRGRVNEPRQRVRIVGVVGEGRKGTEIVAWSYPSSYEHALKSCAAYIELERERIERNPRFRCLEISRVPGMPDFPRRHPIFEGTKEQFEERFPGGLSDPRNELHTEQKGKVEYVRWFERETLEDDKWERCEDPWKIRFQLTVIAARRILRYECTRSDNGSPDFPIWHSKSTGEVVAIASTPKSDQKVVSFHDTPEYLRTVFEGKTAEELWKIGTPDEFDEPTPNTVPDASKYAPSQLADAGAEGER